ncbi:sulfite exporter TauE/SafE family protein [Halovulum dunhuangense]|uniref:Probable membrane transporter protein n=1 Tax=Halovulum dunhuangense TaxID=1505036 RepID=A0A849L3X7_9RHOB|nr:sulfite exporter TauE/SafE family protein [Halovulum dunhuangense]NNU80861.1 sulfite exporter TauE/SafE family protein [Halovulum dunhuangense]
MHELFFAAIAFAAGGVLKGATGAGAPIVVIPVLAMLYDVPTAVAIFAVPSLLANIWQGWAHRGTHLPWRFVWIFALGGGAGVVVGTVLLARLDSEVLLLTVAFVVLAYLAFRLMRPDWSLPFAAARRVGGAAGFLGGILQGASGISAPVSITFLNALRLERTVFISTISIFFAVVSAVQMPALMHFDLMNAELFGLGLAALAVQAMAMPVGAWLAGRVSRQTFDRIIMGLLTVIALRLIFTALP